jgi:hypothetical protein
MQGGQTNDEVAQAVSAKNAASVGRTRSFFGTHPRRDLANRIGDFEPLFDKLDLTTRTAIDIGCAEGLISEWLASRFRRLTAIEVNAFAVGEALKRLGMLPHVFVWQTDIAQQPLKSTYDFVFVLGVLHYVNPRELRCAVLEHCLAHAKEVCVVRTGIREYRESVASPDSPHQHFTTLDDLRRAAGQAFDVHTLNNASRGEGDRRLGDLAVFVRRGSNLCWPALSSLPRI